MNDFKFFQKLNTISDENIRDVAVLCVSLEDFNNWKNNSFAVRWMDGDMAHRFVRNNNRYLAVMSVDSVRTRRFNDVIYTTLMNRRRFGGYETI